MSSCHSARLQIRLKEHCRLVQTLNVEVHFLFQISGSVVNACPVMIFMDGRIFVKLIKIPGQSDMNRGNIFISTKKAMMSSSKGGSHG